MGNSFGLKFLAVFGSVVLSDVCWTKYFLTIQQKRPVAAGLWASSTATIAAFVVVEYTKDWRLILAAVLGSFAGTSLTVWRDKRAAERAARATGGVSPRLEAPGNPTLPRSRRRSTAGSRSRGPRIEKRPRGLRGP